MDCLQIANITIYKMCAKEYDKEWDANVREQYGDNVKELYWADKLDSVTGEVVAQTMEIMLEYADGKFAYTSRHAVVEATMQEALTVMLDSMEEL